MPLAPVYQPRTMMNLLVLIIGMPAVELSLLFGVFREELLAAGEIEERALYPADYDKADTVYIINSVRRFVPCVRLESGSL